MGEYKYMILANGVIVDENFKLRSCDLQIEGEKISGIGERFKQNYSL